MIRNVSKKQEKKNVFCVLSVGYPNPFAKKTPINFYIESVCHGSKLRAKGNYLWLFIWTKSKDTRGICV